MVRLCFLVYIMLIALALARAHLQQRRGLGRRLALRAASSPMAPAAATTPSARPAPSAPRARPTGVFKTRLPDLFEGPTHFKRAQRQLKGVKADGAIKNVRNQQRKLSAQTLDRLGQQLTIPLTESLEAYRSVLRDAHPFERTVCDLVVASRAKLGHPDLTTLLADVKQLRMATSRLSKDDAARASNATSAAEAKDLLADGTAALEALYTDSDAARSLGALVDLQKELRKIPVVELETPTVVLVGAPNVGKSSIVRCVSSGTPEVNDYPFTTRGVTIGHVINKASRHPLPRYQVMDTPGLLDRPEEERNEMENLTFASLLHLPTAVIFVVDPSGLSGDQSSLERQLNVRAALRGRFPRRPWLDVISKGDLAVDAAVLELIASRGVALDQALRVSTSSGDNVDVLRAAVERLLVDLQAQLAAMAMTPR